MCLVLTIKCTTVKATLHQENAIQGYQYCTSMQRAFESLISEDYKNFVLTVGCIGVAIYYKDDIGFKIFDSHARDLHCRGHPQGTCVLLEVSSLNNLTQYFVGILKNRQSTTTCSSGV